MTSDRVKDSAINAVYVQNEENDPSNDRGRDQMTCKKDKTRWNVQETQMFRRPAEMQDRRRYPTTYHHGIVRYVHGPPLMVSPNQCETRPVPVCASSIRIRPLLLISTPGSAVKSNLVVLNTFCGSWLLVVHPISNFESHLCDVTCIVM